MSPDDFDAAMRKALGVPRPRKEHPKPAAPSSKKPAKTKKPRKK
jgi:hypothetical protein